MACSIIHPCIRSDDWRDVLPSKQIPHRHMAGLADVIPLATDGILVICRRLGSSPDSLFIAHATNVDKFDDITMPRTTFKKAKQPTPERTRKTPVPIEIDSWL